MIQYSSSACHVERFKFNFVKPLIVNEFFVLVRFKFIFLDEVLFVQAGLRLSGIFISHLVAEGFLVGRLWPPEVGILRRALLNHS